MEDDWDLHAVVRSCSSSSTTTAASSSSSAAASTKSSIHLEQNCSIKDPWEPSFVVEDLHQLWKPLFKKQQILPISPLSVLQDLPSSEPLHQEIKQFQPQKHHHPFSLVVNASTKPTTPRSKKRKNHSKKVCHVPAESLASDTWSWRKYGQKPIKGSPYPRGYYRCSTLKGCMARKQVERNRSDPGMFIVTYTGDHSHPMPTHRNSLAGSTRQKPATDDPKKPPSSPEKMESSREEDLAEMEEEEDEDDDFFAGLEGFAADCSPENMEFPWMGAAATAAGGG